MFWARWRCFELGESWHHFFPGIFYIFLKCSLFVTDFFFASTGETFFVNPASGTMDITCPKDFPNRSLHTDLNSLYITALHFHFFSCWFFLAESSLAQLYTSVNGSLLFATQPVLFLKRLLSTGVVKRQHLHSTRCRVFFYPGQSSASFPQNMH